jgi:hypothetical protein
VGGRRCAIDIATDRDGERFDLTLPTDGLVDAKVLDLRPGQRHLLLEVHDRVAERAQKFLCGHDEFHWFVAAVPDDEKPVTVAAAMEALKPAPVHHEQRRLRVKRRHRSRRRTAAYVRQGEWFFIPRPELEIAEHRAQQNGLLVRRGGKPHHVEWLHRSGAGQTFARGTVSHVDHTTIRLDHWHEVVVNTEALDERRGDLREQARREQARREIAMNYVD